MKDLEAVRLTAPEPTDENVTRTRHKLTRLQATPIRRTPRLLVPAAAFGVVTALAVAGATLIPRNEAQPWQPAAVSPSPSGLIRLSPRPGPTATTTPPVEVVGPIEIGKALTDLAEKAAKTPAMVLKPGQDIYLKESQWFSADPRSLPPSEAEGRIDPADPYCNHQHESGRWEKTAKDYRKKYGPDFFCPTVPWLADLPTDPGRLLTAMRAGLPTDAFTVDMYSIQALSSLYRVAGHLMSPELKVAFLRALALTQNLTAFEATRDGKKLILVRHFERGYAHDVYYDPATGNAVGRASVIKAGTVADDIPDAKPHPADQENITFWITQSVVD